MAKRLFLPLAVPGPASRPTVDAVRRRLGGRSSTEPGAGQVVSLRDDRAGVVIHVRGDQLDVWLDGDVVRRVRRTEVRPIEGVVPRDLVGVAEDARVFGALREGQRVRYQHEGGLGEGELVEKCRFGALVERGDGTVLGVGFRRLSDPPADRGAPS